MSSKKLFLRSSIYQVEEGTTKAGTSIDTACSPRIIHRTIQQEPFLETSNVSVHYVSSVKTVRGGMETRHREWIVMWITWKVSCWNTISSNLQFLNWSERWHFIQSQPDIKVEAATSLTNVSSNINVTYPYRNLDNFFFHSNFDSFKIC